MKLVFTTREGGRGAKRGVGEGRPGLFTDWTPGQVFLVVAMSVEHKFK